MKQMTRPASAAWLAGALMLAASTGQAAVFQVTSIADGGPGSLRQAMLDANAAPGMDAIHFAIPGNGPHSIQPTSSLPGITSPVVIDGYTQPGASRNNGANGSNANILIEIRGTGMASPSAFNLLNGSTGTTLSGLAINRFGTGVNITLNATNCAIAGNFIGTDTTGTTGFPGQQAIGLSVTANGCRIGGPLIGDRNIVSSMNQEGIYVNASNVTVQGNLVGVDRSMFATVGNLGCGIAIGSTNPGANLATNVRVGGRNEGADLPRNVIGGNRLCGVDVRAGSQHVIEGNNIGITSFSLSPIPNGGPGVRMTGGTAVFIGHLNALHGNVIAYNDGPGILLSGPADNATGPQQVTLIGNTFRDNVGMSIDLAVDGAQGPTPSDLLDADAGPNTLQNHPILTEVIQDGVEMRVVGRIHTTPGISIDIDLYHASRCGAHRRGEADSHLVFRSVQTDGNGDATFEMPAVPSLTQGYLAATASQSSGLVTSEFSPCLRIDDRIFANGFQSP